MAIRGIRSVRHLTGFVVLLLIGALLVACGATAPTGSAPGNGALEPAAAPQAETSSNRATIKIGAIYPLSGAQAQTGTDIKIAVDLAVEIINGAYPDLPFVLAATEGLPGLNNAKIGVIYGDSQARAEVGQSEAERLVNEQVVALYGAYNSAVTKTASGVAERLGLPFVNGDSSSPDLTERDYRWFFRTSPNDLDFSRVMFEFLTEFQQQQGVDLNGVALFYEDTDFGVNSAKAQMQFAQEYGIDMLGEVKYRSRSTALTSEIQQLKSFNADVLLPSSYVNDAILMVRTAKELGFAPKLIIAQNAGYLDNAFIETVADDAEGMLSRAAYAADITTVKEVAATIDVMYQERHDRPLTDAPARAFTGFMALAEAINRAASIDPEAIRTALIAADIPEDQLIMPWKGIRFNEQGQNDLGQAIIIQVQNGQYVTVYPFEFASAEVQFPAVAWATP
ncbi:MAG: ABC transporter substrate-binding protein [Chloroflexales bacterium]|nr:ABC transporter substrate-binding protein [Chloroflexales bacterium]